ncbi:hypothetical protein PGT21_003600 [Puccinia graminis f. sp. tritici]|uniref:Uncharacterized protein n=1 Tax=Puccinia graminis f. sp. tritici TaxID=56615 RepID=A0A5B0PSJ6_PUCGR|nr:hypothetical protein PGTUg99_017991 [Puccinia graminis f. sp. tritici]KAA1103886.1 hypothetical protein PGT21_003600 [Puccinia graminis f. sp. tritici]
MNSISYLKSVLVIMAIVGGIDAECVIDVKPGLCTDPDCTTGHGDPRLAQAVKIWYCDDDDCK